MKTFVQTMVLLTVALAASLAQSKLPVDTLDVSVIPTPQEFEWGIGMFRLTAGSRIVLGSGLEKEDGYAADELNDALQELGRDRLRVAKEEGLRKMPNGVIYLASPSSRAARKFLSQRPQALDDRMKEEGYLLEVTPDGVTIVAESPRGRFYGVMTLVQLIKGQKRSLYVPCLTIRDWPLQSMRGITDDISRGQVSTLDNFKKIIRFCARYKLNVYSPYIEDMFAFPSEPRFGRHRGALTPDAVKELDAYAKRRFVELIPTFETLGHWENILIQPPFVTLAEFPGAHSLNVSDVRVYLMLDQLIGDLASAFSSPYFNIGADESWDVGLGASRGRVAATDLATVHAEHYKRVFAILKKHGKKPMMYGDIILHHPEILGKIPKDVVVIDWHYNIAETYPSSAVFRSAGFPYVASPTVWNFEGPFPLYPNAFVNIRNFAREGYQNGSRGLLTSGWNDNGGEALRELNYLGYAWTAECAWQPLRAQNSDFALRFFRDFFGSDEAAENAAAVYAILSSPALRMDWYDLWRHPMLPLRSNAVNALVRVQALESTPTIVEKLSLRGEVASRRNADHWQYLRFVARLAKFYGMKLRVGEQVRSATQNAAPAVNRDSLNAAARVQCLPVVQELHALRQEYSRLWLTTNRSEGLDGVSRRYARQQLYWMEKGDELERGIPWTDPLIGSRWIYHPNGHPRNRDTSVTQVRFAYFRTSVTLPERLTRASLQLMGDTRVRLFVNGEEAGEVLARRSLSLGVEQQRAQILNIAALVHAGVNTLAVEAENYDIAGSAGLNIEAEFVGADSTVMILSSDSTWMVSDRKPASWPAVPAAPLPPDWVHAQEVAYPVPVVRPDLGRGRTSWFEQ